MWQTKELDKNLPSELGEILEKYQKVETESNLVKDGGHDSVSLDCQASEGLKSSCLSTDEKKDADLITVNTLNANENKRKKYRHEVRFLSRNLHYSCFFVWSLYSKETNGRLKYGRTNRLGF